MTNTKLTPEREAEILQIAATWGSCKQALFIYEIHREIVRLRAATQAIAGAHVIAVERAQRFEDENAALRRKLEPGPCGVYALRIEGQVAFTDAGIDIPASILAAVKSDIEREEAEKLPRTKDGGQ